ncbi:PREDICTED: basic proline-rich protein-like, partial [Chinchilla lanigera]|uniref:basic proline-rich protein-like n=1 Tax=Chinchilla lanigera TaxID=34839 RepID=UPI000697995D
PPPPPAAAPIGGAGSRGAGAGARGGASRCIGPGRAAAGAAAALAPDRGPAAVPCSSSSSDGAASAGLRGAVGGGTAPEPRPDGRLPAWVRARVGRARGEPGSADEEAAGEPRRGRIIKGEAPVRPPLPLRPPRPPRPHLPPPARPPPSARHRPRPLLRPRRWGPALDTWLRGALLLASVYPPAPAAAGRALAPRLGVHPKRRSREAPRKRPPALGGEIGPRRRLRQAPATRR